MQSFTVYESKTTETFRVVAGEHAKHEGAESFRIRIYQGKDTEAAARAAHSGERRADIRAQIERFFTPESRNPSRRLDSVDSSSASAKSSSTGSPSDAQQPAPTDNGGRHPTTCGYKYCETINCPGHVKCAYRQCNKLIPPIYGEPGVSLSRLDNKSLICSDCGTREAFGNIAPSLLGKGATI